MVRPLGDSIYRVFAGSDMNLHLCLHRQKSISVESAEYFLNVEFVLGNIVGIDEMSSKYKWTMTSIISMKISFINLLKSGRCISKPFRHTNHSKGTKAGSGMQSSIRLQVKSVTSGTRAGDQFWYRLLLFVVHLGGWK